MSHIFPRWKYFLLVAALLLGFVYALPNVFGEDPAVQVRGLKGKVVDEDSRGAIETALKEAGLAPKSFEMEEGVLLVRFKDTETQLKAKDVIKKVVGETYSVALNLAPVTPAWLRALGAQPMKLGLDLRGGVHFLMEVDIKSLVNRRMEGYYSEVPKLLREANIRYKNMERHSDGNYSIAFSSAELRREAQRVLQKHQVELSFTEGNFSNGHKRDRHKETNAEAGAKDSQPEDHHSKTFELTAELSPFALQEIRNETVEQTLSTLRNRVNELGVAEALVQRHGLNHIVVELPGIQDTAYARDILGKTATLKFMMMDVEHDIQQVLSGRPVMGSKIYYGTEGRPLLLKNQVILTGESITGASSGQDKDGRPAVNIRLGGDISLFTKTTRENVGYPMATVYVEMKEQGKIEETVINFATINSPLGNSFQITGLSLQAARDLALLLRAGALPAPLSIVEERIVGPSMGQENIKMGMISVAVGMGLVLVFMAIYYSVFGLIADLALIANLILLVALMSLIGATLTLPGIAGIVLTLGMAVDANVLIFERIREELRLGMSPQASIHRGFGCAFATIVDSNLTTLIVGVILFAVGTGPVKGFAVVLCLGILTSLFTATTGSRALVSLLYGKRSIKRVRVGI